MSFGVLLFVWGGSASVKVGVMQLVMQCASQESWLATWIHFHHWYYVIPELNTTNQVWGIFGQLSSTRDNQYHESGSLFNQVNLYGNEYFSLLPEQVSSNSGITFILHLSWMKCLNCELRTNEIRFPPYRRDRNISPLTWGRQIKYFIKLNVCQSCYKNLLHYTFSNLKLHAT